MNDRDTIKTYIIITEELEYYCGKTKDINKRMTEHKNKNGWFQYKNRYKFRILFICLGDYEKNIKSFGVKKFVEMLFVEMLNQEKRVSLS